MKTKLTLTLILVITTLLLSGQTSQAQSFSCANVTEIPAAECEDLVLLYNSVHGTNLTNKTDWLATNTPCSWYGVTCEAGHVTKLNISSNYISGTIPNFTHLPNLTYLDLSSNQLNGAIPNFTNLPNLIELSLNHNQLSGVIPDFTNLPNLRMLFLDYNQLSGTIPNFSNLPKLDILYLGFNQLSGTIPNFSNLPKLGILSLHDNQLSGTIPNFSNLSKLNELFLEHNQLSGTVPNLTNQPNLTTLWLHENRLSGTIPNLNWSNIWFLQLNNNCSLVAYDDAQAMILNGRNANWQTRNPDCVTIPTPTTIPHEKYVYLPIIIKK